MRIGRGDQDFALAIGILPVGDRVLPVGAHELEGLDLLRLPVFEHLKVRGRETLDDPIAPRRVRVDQHEVGPAAEDLTLRGLLGREDRGADRDRAERARPRDESSPGPHCTTRIAMNRRSI